MAHSGCCAFSVCVRHSEGQQSRVYGNPHGPGETALGSEVSTALPVADCVSQHPLQLPLTVAYASGFHGHLYTHTHTHI